MGESYFRNATFTAIISIQNNGETHIGFTIIYYSFNCRDRLRHALFLLFGLFLDNKWIGISAIFFFFFLVEEKKENGSGTLLITVYIYDNTMHISPGVIYPENTNAYVIDYATCEISCSLCVVNR